MRYEYLCVRCDVDFEVDLKLCELDIPVPCPQCKDTYTKRCISAKEFSIKGFSASNNYGLKK